MSNAHTHANIAMVLLKVDYVEGNRIHTKCGRSKLTIQALHAGDGTCAMEIGVEVLADTFLIELPVVRKFAVLCLLRIPQELRSF